MNWFDKIIIAVGVAAAIAWASPPGAIDTGGGQVIEGKGLRVLVKYESEPPKPLPQKQQAALQAIRAGDLREWCKTHCVTLADKGPAFRCWDKDTDVTQQAKFWQDAFAKSPPEPSIMVSNGRKGYAGPFPADHDKTKALLEKYD